MIVKNLEHGRAVIERLSLNKWVSIDTEGLIKQNFGKANGFTPKDALIYSRSDTNIFSMCHKGESYSFVTSVYDSRFPTQFQWGKVLKPLFYNKNVCKVFHNARYDVNVFYSNFDIDCHDKNIWDTMIGCWASNSNRSKSLKERAPHYGRNILKTSTVSFSDLEDLDKYAREDCIAHDEFYQMQRYGKVNRPEKIVSLNAKNKLEKIKNPLPAGEIVVESEDLIKEHRRILRLQEFPILRSAIRAERLGFPIERSNLKEIQKNVNEALDNCSKKILSQFGYYINLNSNQQIAKAFENEGIPLVEKTKKGAPSVSITALVAVRHTHPIVEELIKYRGLQKLYSSYTSDNGLLAYINPDTERIHASLNTVGADTGRTSCTIPNLQQIPSRKDTYRIKDAFGFSAKIKKIKSKFVRSVKPEKKKTKKLIVLDYSQLEIRVQVMGSQDPEMLRVLRDPEGDIHTNTSEKFSVSRSPTAKELNFLLQYGGGNFVLSSKLTFEGVPTNKQQAQSYIDQYNTIYYRVKEWRERLLSEHKRKGGVRLLTKRFRCLEDVDWNNPRHVHKAETTLSNNIVQGSGQDLLKASIVRTDYREPNLDKYVLNSSIKCDKTHRNLIKYYARRIEELREIFRKSNLEWLMQVHDENIFEADAQVAEEIGNLIAEIMGWRHYLPPPNSFIYNVPILAEGGIGDTWGEAKKAETITSPFTIPN